MIVSIRAQLYPHSLGVTETVIVDGAKDGSSSESGAIVRPIVGNYRSRRINTNRISDRWTGYQPHLPRGCASRALSRAE